MPLLGWIILFTAVGGIASAAFAGLFLLLPERTGLRMLPHFVSFATGALIGAALLGLLPEAMESVGPGGAHAIGAALVVGLGIFFIIEKLVLWRHAHSHEHEDPANRGVVARGVTDALSHDDADGVARRAVDVAGQPVEPVGHAAAGRSIGAIGSHKLQAVGVRKAVGAGEATDVGQTVGAGGTIGVGRAVGPGQAVEVGGQSAEPEGHAAAGRPTGAIGGHKLQAVGVGQTVGAGEAMDVGQTVGVGEAIDVERAVGPGRAGGVVQTVGTGQMTTLVGDISGRAGIRAEQSRDHGKGHIHGHGQGQAPDHGGGAHGRGEGHNHGGHAHDHSRDGAAGVLVLIGDSIHNTLDGILIAAAFLTSVPLGLVTTLAVAAHEIPHRVGDFALLLHAGMSRKRALFLNMATGLASVLGGIAAYFGLSKAQEALPYALALAAAGFLYIAVAGLIPGLHRRADPRTSLAQVLLMGLGVGVIAWAESLTH